MPPGARPTGTTAASWRGTRTRRRSRPLARRVGVGLLTVVAGVPFLVGGSPTFGAPVFAAESFAMPSVRDRIGTRPPGWFVAIAHVGCLVLGHDL